MGIHHLVSLVTPINQISKSGIKFELLSWRPTSKFDIWRYRCVTPEHWPQRSPKSIWHVLAYCPVFLYSIQDKIAPSWSEVISYFFCWNISWIKINWFALFPVFLQLWTMLTIFLKFFLSFPPKIIVLVEKHFDVFPC